MNAEQLEAMKNVDVMAVDPDTLVDLHDVHVNPELPYIERFLDYDRQIGNPYCYKCGKLVIKSVFLETGPTITDKLMDFFAGTVTTGRRYGSKT